MINRISVLGYTFYRVATTRGGDTKVIIETKTDAHPEWWVDSHYQEIARTIGVTEDALRAAVREFRARETE